MKIAAIIVLVISGIGPGVSNAHASAQRNRNTDRAVASYQALQKYFYQQDVSLYLEEYPRSGGNAYSYVWPFSQAMAGTIDMSGLRDVGGRYRDDVTDRLVGLDHYWNNTTTPPGYDSYLRPPLGGGGDKFYDDNEWIALEMVQLYRMTGNEPALSRARQIFDLVVYGWDADPSHPAPGGVYWTQAPWSRDRNTVSNAPGAELGLHLYELTSDPALKQYYFDWAKRMYDWTNAHMLAPNGLYWDHIDLNGNVEKTQWSYNQGVMIGASALLYRVTGDESYLQRAESIADAALEYYGTAGRYFTQPARFNAILFKNLLLLQSANNNRKYTQAMQDYADEVWDSVRDPETGLFRFEGERPVTLLEQSAMVEIYASLAWSPRDYNYLA